MAMALDFEQWVALVKQQGETRGRDRLVGVIVTLAARLLDISRSRVHQLLRAKKLTAVDVYDERRTRIGHMVTLAVRPVAAIREWQVHGRDMSSAERATNAAARITATFGNRWVG
jgi:hypothetical protein